MHAYPRTAQVFVSGVDLSLFIEYSLSERVELISKYIIEMVNNNDTKVSTRQAQSTKDKLPGSSHAKRNLGTTISSKHDKSLSIDADIHQISTWQYILAYSIITISIGSIAVFALSARDKNPLKDEGNIFKIPTTIGDAKRIGLLLARYKNSNLYSMFAAYAATYIILQSLCIPGSIALSILAGYLFPAPVALMLICTCSTLGASTFYIMIYTRRRTIFKFLNRVLGSWLSKFENFVHAKMKEYNSNLFLIVFILRATPVFPNWTINLCSPLINLPLKPFVLGTFTGIAPLSVIHVWTGSILNDLSNDQSLFNWQSVFMTSLVAISIVFLMYVRRIASMDSNKLK